jgi:hypothetical protein
MTAHLGLSHSSVRIIGLLSLSPVTPRQLHVNNNSTIGLCLNFGQDMIWLGLSFTVTLMVHRGRVVV